MEWAVVRASFFAQNFSEGFLVDAVRAGVLALPAGSVGEPFVDADDLADTAVAALTAPVAPNRVYELTGPRPLTFAEVAAELSAAAGHEVVYLPVTRDEFVAGMVVEGVPATWPARTGSCSARCWTVAMPPSRTECAPSSAVLRAISPPTLRRPLPPACGRRPSAVVDPGTGQGRRRGRPGVPCGTVGPAPLPLGREGEHVAGRCPLQPRHRTGRGEGAEQPLRSPALQRLRDLISGVDSAAH